MPASLIVPVSGPEHARLWRFVRARYERLHGFEIIETDGGDPWCKGASVEAGVQRASHDLLVIADADSFVDPVRLRTACDGAQTTGWALPFSRVRRLNPSATALVLGGEEAHLGSKASLERPEYAARVGGGIVVVTRAAYRAVGGIDQRFIGWGGEDEAFGWALQSLVGTPVVTRGPLWHLWHEGARELSEENRRLAVRYRAAWQRGRPEMRMLIAEERGAVAPP